MHSVGRPQTLQVRLRVLKEKQRVCTHIARFVVLLTSDHTTNKIYYTAQHREYPVDWITRHMEMEGLRIIKTKSFNILHTVESASRQIRVAQTKLDLMPSSTLRAGMSAYLEELTERVRVAVASNGGKIPLSFDYIVAAELPPAENLGATIFSLLAAPFAGGGAGADGAGGDAAAAAAAAAGAGAEAGEVGIANPPTPLGHGHDH